MKLIVCDPTDSEAIAAMREEGIEVDICDSIEPEELEEVIHDYHAMVVRSRTKVRATLIDKADNLRLVIRAGVGVDNIDVRHARSKRVAIRNTAAAPSNSVAELTIGYLFALARSIPQMTASMKAGKWEKKAFSRGVELEGKTLGCIGCGRIGSLVAQKALKLGMSVVYYCIDFADIPGADPVSLETLLGCSDFISLHIPYTPETHYLIGAAEFEKMKDGVFIVNTGRGGTLDEEALYNAIVNGKVAGAALDVFEDEKVERGQRLMQLPQVIGSPHIGSGTLEAKVRVGQEVACIATEFVENHL